MENELYYNELTPPLYDLKKIRVPVVVIYSAIHQALSIEKFYLDPVASGLTSVIIRTMVNTSLEGFYMGFDMKWFKSEVVDLMK